MARPNKHKKHYKYVGRPTKLSDEVVRKLEEAATIRATIPELCYYAGISRDTYYRWMKENPELSDRLDDLRQNPLLRARRTIIGRLDTDVNVAFRFLEKEKPEEYGEKIKIEHKHSEQIEGGQTDNTPLGNAQHKLAVLRDEYHEKARKIGQEYWHQKEQEKPQ